jgi:hypothetical protein
VNDINYNDDVNYIVKINSHFLKRNRKNSMRLYLRNKRICESFFRTYNIIQERQEPSLVIGCENFYYFI